MRTFFRLSCLFVLGIFLLSACKKNPSSSKKPLLEQLGVKNTDFTFLEARGKITYEDEQQRLKSAIIIRMAKDSLIWVSLRPALGIEALRVLIRPDSVFALDRLHNKYMAFDMKGLSQKVNFDLDFRFLQALILGNTLPLEGGFGKPIKGEESFLVMQNAEIYEIESQISRLNKKLVGLEVRDTVSDNQMQLSYKSFENLADKRIVPFESKAVVDYLYEGKNKRSTLVHEIQRMDFKSEPISFPFKVPEKFTKE